jgi:PilZ domain
MLDHSVPFVGRGRNSSIACPGRNNTAGIGCAWIEANMTKTSLWRYAERREDPRSHLQLKLAVLYPQVEGRPHRPMFHGKTHDISVSGLSLVVDYNVFQEGEVTVVLALPPARPGASPKVVTSTAEMTYAIHSTKLDAYKIGLSFHRFRGDGKALLEAALREASGEDGGEGVQDPDAGPDVNPFEDNEWLDLS